MSEPWREDETVYVTLQLGPKLPLQVKMLERDEHPMPVLSDETLSSLIDDAIDNAAYEGDWQGLIRLHRCLRRQAKEVMAALRQIGDEGSYRDAHPSKDAVP